MLIDNFNKMKITCAKLMVCNLLIGIGILIWQNSFKNGSAFSFHSIILIACGITLICIVIGQFMKKLCVSHSKIKVPKYGMLILGLLFACTKVFVSDSFIFILGYGFGLFICMVLWAHKMFMKLPNAMREINPEIQRSYPIIFDKGIGRISEKNFLLNMNQALEQIPKERFTFKMLEGIEAWYSVYVGYCFVLEGLFLGMFLEILL